MNPLENPLSVDLEKCNGCAICEAVCAMEKGVDAGESRIKILRTEEMGIFFPVITIECDLCDGAPKCEEHCPPKALKFVALDEALRMRKKMQLQTLFSPVVEP